MSTSAAEARYIITATDRSRSATESARRNFKQLNEQVESAQKLLKKAFVGVSVASVIQGITQIGARAIEMGDELNKAKIKAGVTARAISELAFAAKMSDVDLSSLSTALRFMQKNLSEAETGSKSSQLAFRALNLTLADLRGLAADKQFELIADRISKLTDEADRSRAATELFGRAGADLLPLFESGAEGIRKAREEAAKFNLSFSEDQIKKLADADDAIKRMSASFSGLATTLTARVAPALTSVLDSISAVASGDKIAKLRAQIEALENKRGPFSAFGQVPGVEAFRKAQLEKNRRQLNNLLGTDRRGVIERPGAAAPPPDSKKPVGFAAAQKEVEAQEELKKIRKDFAADHEKLQRETYDNITDAFKEASEEQGELLGGWSQVFRQTMDEMAAYTRDTTNEMSVFWDEAFRSMQDQLADFLFDPFEDGLRGMLKGFVDTLRRMAAEAAAAKVFDFLKGAATTASGKGGFWGAVFKGAKSLFGFQTGGAFTVGGTGGPDSQVVSFRASPGERVTVGQSGTGGGGAQIVINNTYDMRHSTSDVMSQMPEILRKRDEALKADIIGGIRSRKYPI